MYFFVQAWVARILANFTSAIVSSSSATFTGGVVANTLKRLGNIPVGAVGYSSLGTSATPVDGTIYFSELYVPSTRTVTGVAVLNGGAVGTDKGIAALYSEAGALLGNSATAGATTANTNTFQEYDLTAPITVPGPGRYWIAWQTNGTTTRVRTIAASTYLNLTKSQTGTFGTLPATFTPPTTFTADVGPIAYVY